jgi:uncharacterized OsmC-like protein
VNARDLRELYEQKARALKRHPSLGQGRFQATIKLVDTFACEARRANRVMRVDLPVEEGGSDTGPTPGDLMRTSLGACMAIGYRAWAARLGVPLSGVCVEVTCEVDARGQLGIADDVPFGWQRLIFDVRITSDAPPDEIRRVVAHADRLSPMLANLSPALERVHTLSIEPQAF